MRTILTITFVAAAAATAAAQPRAGEPLPVHARLHAEAQRERAVIQRRSPRQGPEQTERTTHTVRIGANGELDVSNIAGDIVITRASGSETTIDVTRRAHGESDEQAREMLGMVQVEISERGNRAEVRTRHGDGRGMRRGERGPFRVAVEIAIATPAGTRVRAQSMSGGITVKDITGDVSVESVSGHVRITNGGRIATAKSIAGNVEVEDSTIDRPLQISTASGRIAVRRVTADQITAAAISGDVLLEDVTCPRLKAQTISGTVRFSGPLAANARFTLGTHSGNVEVGIPGGSGFELDATSFSGGVRSDFPLTSPAGAEPAGHRRETALRGVHGDGSALLTLTTFSGSIVISKR
jgi:hypothetical protein